MSGHPSVNPVALILPGLLVAATGVGAGDLITASLASMRVGFVILWAVPLGVVLKYVLTEGIARWQLATGTTLLEGWVQRLGRWIEWVFLTYLLVWSFVVGGALVNACGVAGYGLVPVAGDPRTAKIIWGFAHSLAGLALVYFGGYRSFEKTMGASVAVMFVTVLLTAVLKRPDWGAVAKGLVVPAMPPGALPWVLGLLGGVGGTVTILSYGYWIREKDRTGEEGLRTCRIDLGVAYALTGLFSVGMIIIARDLTPEGTKGAQLAIILSRQLGETLGPVGQWCFLLGFWGAVFSSLLGVWQSVPYMFADFMLLRRSKRSGATKQHDNSNKVLESTREYKGYLVGIAIVPLVTLWLKFEAVQLTYAVMGAFFMPILALTLLMLNNRTQWVGSKFRNGLAVNALLVFTLLLFGYVGARKIRSTVLTRINTEQPVTPSPAIATPADSLQAR